MTRIVTGSGVGAAFELPPQCSSDLRANLKSRPSWREVGGGADEAAKEKVTQTAVRRTIAALPMKMNKIGKPAGFHLLPIG
jgi:hypothetical protein